MAARSFLLLLFIGFTALPGPALGAEKSVATTWRLLDYIAVDYREAVKDGAIVNAGEFAEMTEFSATAAAAIDALPSTGGSAELSRQAAQLQRSIQDKHAPEAVAAEARALAALLVRHYPIPLAPAAPPRFERGQALYAENCVSCHGASGRGDGPAALGLDPPPIDFTDRARADERSVAALYQVITQGLEGTSMASYASLPEEDRWALATYVGALAYPAALADQGRRLLEDRPSQAPVDLGRVVGETPAAWARERSASDAAALAAYLRRHPDAVAGAADLGTSLARSRELLGEALSAYRGGDPARAQDAALAAYLDGFEPVEPLLAARDKSLMVEIEAAMARVRSGIAAGIGAEQLEAQVEALDGLYSEAEALLSRKDDSSASSFVAAFTILFREGLEALLIVVAMIAMLRKAERADALPWIHAGWTAALLAGVVTWMLATWVITISGAGRELTEGFGSLLAAVVLVWVGIWMHGKSHAAAWQHYVREKLSRALSRRSGFFLLALAFVVVYREVLETILFFAAIWNQGGQASVVAGGGAAALALFAIGWAMLRYSRKLPVGQFFRYSSILIAILAVVLIGKAVSALQEAGYLPVTWFQGGWRVEILGLYPTLQGIAAQVGMASLLVVGFLLAGRSRPSLTLRNG